MTQELPHLLLVEDNDADVYLFRKAFDQAGVRVHLTVLADGAEALAYIGKEEHATGPVPALAVIDLNLPKDDGAHVVAALRASARFASVPVVIATSSASPAERSRSEFLGVEYFLTKPPDLEGFLQLGVVLRELLQHNGGKPSGS